VHRSRQAHTLCWSATVPYGISRVSDCACQTTSLFFRYRPSPELNPMENIWDYLRGNQLSRRVWDSYEAIIAACKVAWDFLIGDPERISSIARRSWAWVNP
jgi:hypothetical protein